MPIDYCPVEPFPEFLEHKSTLVAPPTERIDHWRAWHPTMSLNPLAKPARIGLDAQLVRYRAPDGIMFGFANCDSMESYFGNVNLGNYFLLGALISGTGTACAGGRELSYHAGDALYILRPP